MKVQTLTTIDIGIIASASIFITVLQVSAYFDKSIITLHIAESLPYIIGPALCLRHSKLGYALTFASGVFWLWCGVLLTTFVRNGFEQLIKVIQTGILERIDIVIAVPAAIGTAGLATFSLIGYFRLGNKTPKDAVLFLLMLFLVALFFLAIFKIFAPVYLQMFRGVLF